MVLHSPAAARKLWNILRIAFFMTRKGLASKRKLMLDMNLMMKRGKLLGKSLGNLLHHHHHHHSSGSTTQNGRSFGLGEYEFSCTNTPNPIFFRVNSKRKHSYFPCINASSVDDELDLKASPVIVLPSIEFSSPKCTYNSTELASGEIRCTPIPSPLSVRLSNFSLAEEGDGLSCEVDNQAEEFIKRFYQQLQAQGRIALLQYQEEEYQEMLARGV